MTAITNRLDQSTSNYLRQHRDQPVAWQQWSSEVLELAQQQDKPILLSIGYSTCHWCHVMTRESFTDPETAELMNSMFINIKVDREERQDLNLVYQHAHQFLTGQSGGWPLTVFLCPRTHLPFLVGTYFSNEAVKGRLSFKELLVKVNDYYHTRGKDFIDTLDTVRQRYEELGEAEQTLDGEAALNTIPIDKATIDILKEADVQYGGFGNAPKFAMPAWLERLLVANLEQHPAAAQALSHLNLSLLTMARSGIADLVGGGFFRYAIDTHWTIPHFEKMLYDNALLLAVYAQAWSVTGENEIEHCVRGMARWALQEMRAPTGGFYSAVNAEVDGKAGDYYTWLPREFDAVLAEKEKAIISNVFDLDKFPNYQQRYHLHRQRPWSAIVDELEMDASEVQSVYYQAMEKLHQHRREKPSAVDEQIQTGWNGLMIRALAIAARVFADQEYLQAATQAVDFIRDNLFVNKRLYGSWCDNQPTNTAYLDDYAFLVDGILELLRIQWRDEDYRFISQLLESMMANFEDKEGGGFYFSPYDAEQLIYRGKPFGDNIIPAGNGIAAKVLGRYGHLTTEPHYLQSAERTLRCAWASMLRTPKNHHSCLLALTEYLQPPPHVLLKGDSQMDEWRHQIQMQFGERVHCYWIPDDSELHPPELFLLEGNQALVCSGDHCLEPQSHLAELLAQVTEVLENPSEKDSA